jgi:acetyl esterase/lipase
MKTRTLIAMLLGTATVAVAQTPSNSLLLWPDGAPGALGTRPQDIPTLTPVLPEAGVATGAAMVVCPGGAYAGLAAHEGVLYGRWLADHGVAAFVLKYRLGSSGYRHPAMLQDAARAVRTVRANARNWALDTNRVGIIGSSAGGHLVSTLMTHFDAGKPDAADPIERVSSRPDIAVLCYPVITMGKFTHQGSKNNLLGRNPSRKLVQELSSELNVRKDSPPAFIWATYDDKTVPVENSLQFASALRAAGVPFDLHIYQHGAHGLGLGTRGTPGPNGALAYDPSTLHPWTADLLFWLRAQNFVK